MGNVALLHDFDYERHPTLDQHPQDGAPVLRERGYPEWSSGRCSRTATTTGVTRETQLEKTLYACDELSGFVHACGLVRPDGIATLEPKSVRKKLKQPSFAKGVNRDDVTRGAKELGVDLNEHIAFVIGALRPVAPSWVYAASPAASRSMSPALVNAPTDTRIHGVPGMKRTSTPASASLAVRASVSPAPSRVKASRPFGCLGRGDVHAGHRRQPLAGGGRVRPSGPPSRHGRRPGPRPTRWRR